MRHIPVRIGPLALLLTVISICLTTLGVLAFTTARADMNLAEKYAATVHIRYELEELGQTFLKSTGEMLENGVEAGAIPGTETTEEGVLKWTAQCGDFRLAVGIMPQDGKKFRIVYWNIQKDWEPEEGFGDLWLGEW